MIFASPGNTHIRVSVALLLAGILAIGFWLRVKHLGDLGLVVDEGVEVLAVQGILKHGLPKFESGLVYSRALPFLYIQAASAKIFGLNEFSLRFPAVLFGLASILATFFLAKSVFGWRVGALAAAVMAFSVWQIELSRYGRFYTAFQFTYQMALFCFYRGFISGERAYRFWFVVAAVIAFLMHDLGVMLASCFFILLPSTAYSARRKLVFSMSAAGLVGLWLLYYRMLPEFLQAIAGPPLPIDSNAPAASILEKIQKLLDMMYFQVPDVTLVAELSRRDPFLFFSLVAVAMTATGYLLHRRIRGNDGRQVLLALPIVWTAFVYQIGLLAVVVGVYLVFFMRGARTLREPVFTVAGGAAAVCLFLWSLVPAMDPTVSTRRLLWAMFSYPNFYDYFLRWYLWGWPLLTIVSTIGALQLITHFMANRARPALLFIPGAILIPALIGSLFQPSDDAVRYTIHLYPAMVILFAVVTCEIIGYCHWRFSYGRLRRGVIATAVMLAALFISQDANPVAAWSVGDWTYRTARHPIRNIGGWDSGPRHHEDHKTPSLYVRRHIAPQDRVIVLGGPVAVAIYRYYIGRVDYALANRPAENALRLPEGKLVDIYVASEMISIKFRITQQSLQSLQSESVPRRVLKKLEDIKDREYTGQPEFFNALRTVLGVEQLYKHRASLFKHAVVRTPDACCRIKQMVENDAQGGIWLLGDWRVLMTDQGYPDPTKEYLRSRIRKPDYLGLDGRTFAVKLR